MHPFASSRGGYIHRSEIRGRLRRRGRSSRRSANRPSKSGTAGAGRRGLSRTAGGGGATAAAARGAGRPVCFRFDQSRNCVPLGRVCAEGEELTGRQILLLPPSPPPPVPSRRTAVGKMRDSCCSIRRFVALSVAPASSFFSARLERIGGIAELFLHRKCGNKGVTRHKQQFALSR